MRPLAADVGVRFVTQQRALGLLFQRHIRAALRTTGALEAFALRQERLGLIYVGIRGEEVMFIGLVSFLYFDETYTRREITGMALVPLGAAMAWTLW